MASNRRLARSIKDGSFFEFRRQLDYKARMYGAIVVADRWFPSTCSCCGSLNTELASLLHRTFRCDACGVAIDPDLNAARNLERLATSCGVSLWRGALWRAAQTVRETIPGEAGTEQHRRPVAFIIYRQAMCRFRRG